MDMTLNSRVMELQREMINLPELAYQPFTKHTFHGGMYCREVFRHAGTVIVGAVHKKEHFYLIVAGTVTISTDEGPMVVTGPCLINSVPGTKRAVYANTDALCMTFHRTDAQTVAEAEAELVEDDPSSMFDSGNILKSPLIEVSP